MKTALHMKDLAAIVTTTDNDFDFLNSILITEMTYPLCPERSSKTDGFPFFTF